MLLLPAMLVVWSALPARAASCAPLDPPPACVVQGLLGAGPRLWALCESGNLWVGDGAGPWAPVPWTSPPVREGAPVVRRRTREVGDEDAEASGEVEAEGRAALRPFLPLEGGPVRGTPLRLVSAIGDGVWIEGEGEALAIDPAGRVLARGAAAPTQSLFQLREGRVLSPHAGRAWPAVPGDGVHTVVGLPFDAPGVIGASGLWSPHGSGWDLVAPGVWSVGTRWGDDVVLAGATGLVRVRWSQEEVALEAQATGPSIDALLRAVLPAASAEPSRTGRLGWLAPQVSAELRWAPDAGAASSLDGGLGSEGGGALSGGVWATWTPPSRSVTARALGLGAPPQTGRAALLDGGGASVAAGRTQERERVSQVISLWTAREALAAASGVQGLRESTRHALRVAELDALVNALTGGALDRLRAGVGR